jgi:hypothetical protein
MELRQLKESQIDGHRLAMYQTLDVILNQLRLCDAYPVNEALQDLGQQHHTGGQPDDNDNRAYLFPAAARTDSRN